MSKLADKKRMADEEVEINNGNYLIPSVWVDADRSCTFTTTYILHMHN